MADAEKPIAAALKNGSTPEQLAELVEHFRSIDQAGWKNPLGVLHYRVRTDRAGRQVGEGWPPASSNPGPRAKSAEQSIEQAVAAVEFAAAKKYRRPDRTPEQSDRLIAAEVERAREFYTEQFLVSRETGE